MREVLGLPAKGRRKGSRYGTPGRMRILALLLGLVLTALGVPRGLSATASPMKDYSITEAYWDDSSEGTFMARWEKPLERTSYKVQLYRGSTKIGKEVSANSEKYDFTSRIAGKGSGGYHFIVYAQKDRSYSAKSDVLDVDYDLLEEVRKIIRNRERLASEGRSETTGRGVAGVAGGPGVARIFDPKTGSGGWNKFEEKWWWKKPDGTAARAEWLYTGGKWYYLGDDYMMRTGWIQDQGKWYYLGSDGAMLAGTVTPDGYTLSESGEWIP